MESLITENLILRKAKLTDLELIWKNVWSDEQIAANMLWKVTETREDAIERLNRTIKYQSENYAYFVCLKSNDEPIGFAGIKEKENGIYEESGICIARKYQGRGFAKEVVQALKQLIFDKLDGNRFIYGCFSDNEKSKKVCISQGFKYFNSEKNIREWDNKEFLVDYYYFDRKMYCSTKIIYFVHGTTTDNAEKLCSGWKEAMLNELGRQQAENLGNVIRERKIKFDVLYTSDLQRAIDSSNIAFPEYEKQRDNRLRECNYGDLDGQHKSFVIYEDHIDDPFPNGESLKQVENRVRKFTEEIKEKYPGKTIGIVAHRAPQLALEVITKNITWEEAIKNDWRKTGAWQPGWEYII